MSVNFEAFLLYLLSLPMASAAENPNCEWSKIQVAEQDKFQAKSPGLA